MRTLKCITCMEKTYLGNTCKKHYLEIKDGEFVISSVKRKTIPGKIALDAIDSAMQAKSTIYQYLDDHRNQETIGVNTCVRFNLMARQYGILEWFKQHTPYFLEDSKISQYL